MASRGIQQRRGISRSRSDSGFESALSRFASCRAESGNPAHRNLLCQFNSDLILLKPSRNGNTLPYSHWGGTDHEELEDPHQRRGSGSSILRKHPQASRSTFCALLHCPAFASCLKDFPLDCDPPRGAFFLWLVLSRWLFAEALQSQCYICWREHSRLRSRGRGQMVDPAEERTTIDDSYAVATSCGLR